MPKEPSEEARKLTGGHFNLENPVAGPDPATQLTIAQEIHRHYKALSTPFKKSQFLAKDHVNALKKFIEELKRRTIVTEGTPCNSETVLTTPSEPPQPASNAKTSPEPQVTTAPLDHRLETTHNAHTPSIHSNLTAIHATNLDINAHLQRQDPTPPPQPSSHVQNGILSPFLRPDPNNLHLDIHHHDHDHALASIPTHQTFPPLSPEQYTASSSNHLAGLRDQSPRGYQELQSHQPGYSAPYQTHQQHSWSPKPLFRFPETHNQPLYTFNNHTTYGDGPTNGHYPVYPEDFSSTGLNRVATNQDPLVSQPKVPYTDTNPVVALDAYTINQFVTSYKSALNNPSEPDPASCLQSLQGIISRLEHAHQGSTQASNDISWPHFDTNSPTFQDVENVFEWLVNKSLTQPLEKPSSREAQKKKSKNPEDEKTFFHEGQLIPLTQTIITQARKHPGDYPGVIEQGFTFAQALLTNRTKNEKCLACVKKARGRTAESKPKESHLACGCPIDLACLELWMVKFTGRDIRGLTATNLQDIAQVLENVSGHTAQTIFHDQSQRRNHTAKWVLKALASHFSSEAERLKAAGEHEDAMYEEGVAKKYEEAWKHVSEIWDERQKRHANDRAQMAAECAKYPPMTWEEDVKKPKKGTRKKSD